MRFHQRVLELFGQPGLSLDFERGDRLRQLASASGVRLPAAVAEWYCVPEASVLWKWYTGSDYPAVSFHTGGREPWMESAEREGDSLVEDERNRGWWLIPRPREDVRGLIREPILPVVYETQGCCWWGVPLGGSDDPPVVVCLGDQGDQWDYFAASFSDFVLARVFDMSLYYRYESRRCVVIDEDVNGDQLRALRQMFRHEVTTRQHGGELFVQRFSGEGQGFSLTIAGRDTRYTGSSEWQLLASDDDRFRSLVQVLRGVFRRLEGVLPGGPPLYLRGEMTATELEQHCKEFPF